MEDASEKKSRPTSIEEMEILIKKIFPGGEKDPVAAFQPRPDDMVISPYAKCGTTWLQQITHGLRTRGSMDFEEISYVVPWIESAHMLGIDLDAPHGTAPRVFKSHYSYYDIPKGGRYICAFRHPYDAARSYYRFKEGWHFETGSVSLEALLAWRYPPDQMHEKGYWHHLISWWEQRDNPDVLLLCYEDMVRDLPGTVEKVARFMGIPLDPALHEIVIRQSSKEFMLAHQDQFDERGMRRRSEVLGGLPPNSSAHKVTNGPNSHPRYALTPSSLALLDGNWREQIEARFGFPDYEAFSEALRAHQGRS